MPEADKPVPLPPGLDLLWGRRERGKRGPRAGLSADAIVAAAIEVADSEGLEAVSMARVAHKLGFTTMSLYRHVASKEELLQLMWEASTFGAEELVLEGDGWRPRLRMWAIIQRQVLDHHPWITQLPMASPPAGPNSLLFVERALETFDGTGLADSDKLRVIGLLSSYSLSEARMARDAAQARAQAQAGEGVQAALPTFESVLRQLVDEKTYPRLYRLAWQGDSATEATGEFEEYLAGIDIILDGVAALIERAREAGSG